MRRSDRERFGSRWVGDASGCWLWAAALQTKGYGQFTLQGSEMLAHRAAWILNYGAIPDGLFVCHRCDVRRCVNPAHLFLGTNRDNLRDSASKGRGAHMNRTDTNGPLKLSEVDRAEIICLRGKLPMSVIARRFDTSRSSVARLHGKAG
jgi:hypothetical protein